MPIATLGDFVFEIDSACFDALNRSTEYGWVKGDRILREPSQQFVGKGGDEIKLPGVIYPFWKGGLQKVDALREAAEKGEPLLLVRGDGEVMGRWCITRISEQQAHLTSDGTPRKQTFTLELARYGNDVNP